MSYKKTILVGIGLLLLAARTNHEMSRAIPIPMIPIIPINIGIGIRIGMENYVGFSQEGKYLLYHGHRYTGMFETHFENGNLKSQAIYQQGLLEGISLSWFPQGSLESRRDYNQGEKNGLHQGWWPDGTRRFEDHFSNGVYAGTFSEWYPDGKALHAFTYDQGKEVRAIGWRENGKTYINFEVRKGRKYGLTNARLCYSLKDEQGVFKTVNN